jgi:hypothetical protein
MTIEQLRKALHARPFRRFDICLADGQRFPVPHPECLLVPPQASRTFVVYSEPESYQVLDLLLVTALDFPGGRARSNGKARRNGRKK